MSLHKMTRKNQKSTGFTEKLVKNISAADSTTSEDGCSIVCALPMRMHIFSISVTQSQNVDYHFTFTKIFLVLYFLSILRIPSF